MNQTPLYPLRFDPIYQYRLWGGRRLATLLSTPLPGDGPIGEAWLLSDRSDHQSLVTNGPLKGRSIGQLMEQFKEQLMGKLSSRFNRFPLLLKFLDAHEMLSVQVHPSAAHPELIPAGDTAKTEAWVVIEAEKEAISMLALDRAQLPAYCGNLLTTAALRTTWCALPRSRAMPYLFLRERFTLWGTMLSSLRFSKTVM
jgi:mannose-6-phosphate isomerase class I